MYSLNDTVLKSNKYLKINFNGGDLSSDGGMLLIKEFAAKTGLIKEVKKCFKPMILQQAGSIRMQTICYR